MLDPFSDRGTPFGVDPFSPMGRSAFLAGMFKSARSDGSTLVAQRRDEEGDLHLTVNDPQISTRRDEADALHITVSE